MFRMCSMFLIFFRVGPIRLYRERIKLPIIRFLYDTVELYKSRTKQGITNVKDVLFRGTVLAFLTSVLVWLSVFMYVAFYFGYVPAVSHERSVYFQFASCPNNKGICNFPSAHVQLTRRQQLLMSDQSYKIYLELEMPESPANQELGMFMACADFRDKNGKLVANSCRSAMLRYKSFLLEVMYKVFFSPFFLMGQIEEKQHVNVELFSEYQEFEDQPVTDVYVEIQSRYIELYSAKFLISAQFSGLRYIMFHWPVLSAAIGITSNLFFVAIVAMISWYQLTRSEEYKSYVKSKQELEYFKDSSSCSSFEGAEETKDEMLRKRHLEQRNFLDEIDATEC